MRSVFLSGLLVSAAIGVHGVAAASDLMAIPRDYRGQILSHVKAAARDPSSIRDVEMTEPRPMFMGVANRIASCVRFNAKNGFGGLTGRQTYVAVFLGGVLSSVEPDETMLCRSASGYASAKL